MKKTRFLLCLLLCVLVVAPMTACSGSHNPTSGATPDENPAYEASADLEKMVNLHNALKLDLENTHSIPVGVSVSDSGFTITKGGTYHITGSLENGQLRVNAHKQEVWLVLDSVSISCNTSSPLYIEDAKNTYLVLKTGSKNFLSDTADYETDQSGDPDATLFCKNDLKIGGGGSLEINSNFNNAIHTKDTLEIQDGSITITSVDTGIIAKDQLTINGGILDITAEGDGIKTSNSEDTTLGNLSINSGNISINSKKDAIQSENKLDINSGTLNLTTGDGAGEVNAFPGGFPMDYNYSDTAESTKGLKSVSTLSISGGEFTLNTEDDAVHSNSDISISGGTFSIKSGDDGIHADAKLSISGGNIDITQSYEGIEGSEIHITGGDISATSTDDGLNSAGGGDTTQGGFGRDSFQSAGDFPINISGGNIYIDAAGDGIDSNSTITIDGGTVIVNGPENDGNSPIDWERECIINGGLVIAAGYGGMMGSVSDASAQHTIAISMNTVMNAGTAVNVSGGDMSLTFTPSKSYTYILVSTSDIKADTAYTISTGGGAKGDNTHGLCLQGSYSGGEEYVTVTTHSIVTTYGNSGMGGPMGGGPMGGGPMGGGPMGGGPMGGFGR